MHPYNEATQLSSFYIRAKATSLQIVSYIIQLHVYIEERQRATKIIEKSCFRFRYNIKEPLDLESESESAPESVSSNVNKPLATVFIV